MRRVLGIVVIALFALRSLLPAGVMLRVATPEGPLEIVICTGDGGMKTVKVDTERDPRPSSDGAGGPDQCPFSMISATAVLRDGFVPLKIVAHDAAVQYRIVVDLFSKTPRIAGRSARGPPTILT